VPAARLDQTENGSAPKSSAPARNWANFVKAVSTLLSCACLQEMGLPGIHGFPRTATFSAERRVDCRQSRRREEGREAALEHLVAVFP